MEDDPLRGKRVITNEDLAEIVRNITPIEGVDETLFTTVLKDLMAQRIGSIKGTEDDPKIKAELQKREDIARDRSSQANVKLTREEADANYFPSYRTGHYPKFYDESEIPIIIVNKARELEAELIKIFTIDETPENDEPRKLTDKEKTTIFNMINYSNEFKGDRDNVQIDPYVAEFATNRLLNDLKLQLDSVVIAPSGIGRLTDLIYERFQRSLALPGKMVGAIMAASFGEAATQQTLNTFHAAGDRNARKQITGFAKFDAILKSTENPQSSRMIVFLKKRSNKNQLLAKASNFELTILSDLVRKHRIIRSDSPKPRWEKVHEIVSGIRADYPSSGKDRVDIHRNHDAFLKPDEFGRSRGRILEITLDVQMLYRKRISMSLIKNAIEEKADDIRVATSSMDIGIIYIYHRFVDLANMANYGFGGEPPPFITDHFQFALENLVYPFALKTLISGIEGIEYVTVQQYQVKTAIDFSRSTFTNSLVSVAVNREKAALWAITPQTMFDFLSIKLLRFNPDNAHYNLQYNQQNRIYSFNIESLKEYDPKEGKWSRLKPKTLEKELESKSGVSIYEYLVPSNPIESNGDRVIYTFNLNTMDLHGVKMDNIVSAFKSGSLSLPYELEAEYRTNQIVIGGLAKLNEGPGPDVIKDVMKILKESTVEPSRIEDLSTIWYYDISGRNLSMILAHPDVDSKHTRSDNVVEVYRALGVETCRAVLITEIAANTDTKLNPSHIELLADSLTYRTPADRPLSQDQHGLNKRGADFTVRAYETTTKVLLEAGLGQVDNLQSFPSQILLGQLSYTNYLTREARDKILETDTFRYDYPEPSLSIEDKPSIAKPASVPIVLPTVKEVSTKALKKRVKKQSIGAGVVPPKPRTGASAGSLFRGVSAPSDVDIL